MAGMNKRIEDFTITRKKIINKDYFILDLKTTGTLPEILPGQFAELRIDHTTNVFLRRPISFYDVDYKQNTIRLLIAVVGKGTSVLSQLEKGSIVNMIYPLGNGFSMTGSGSALLIGGGIGVAPLLYLGKYLKKNGIGLNFLLGYRSKQFIVEPGEFKKLGSVYITTDDGTAGVHGLVTSHPVLMRLPAGITHVFACGPLVMMQAIAVWAKEKGLFCEVSLENTMACGFGACLCCAQATTQGNRLVCIDGPVFKTSELVW
jgi:dihydroorotate dehydrogenase electron transfer subunit